MEITALSGLLSAFGLSASAGLNAYIPLLIELDTQWEVRPFAFDWRKDIRKSAERLAGEIRAFGAGDPVHLVCHSMGGLVSRYVANCFTDAWDAIDEPGRGIAGGRLVMLGTPNRGSFAPVEAMTADDKLVRRLAIVDVFNSLEDIRSVIATFPQPSVNLEFYRVTLR